MDIVHRNTSETKSAGRSQTCPFDRQTGDHVDPVLRETHHSTFRDEAKVGTASSNVVVRESE